jgi:hypothetical protein
MTIYFYDTEFLEDGSTIDLISIGIVSETGREYYAVNSDMDHDRIKKDRWLCENVVRHLPLRGTMDQPRFGSNNYLYTLDRTSALVKPKWVIANEVRDFLRTGGDTEQELWAYYGAYDHLTLMQLWGKMINKPATIPMWTHDLMQLAEDVEGFVFPELDGDEHHALADARWNRKVYNALMAPVIP